MAGGKKCQSDTHAEKQTLTFQNVGDEVLVCADVLDLVEAGQSLDGKILVAVHLRVEVQVAAEVLPVDGERTTISIEEGLERLQSLRHVTHDGQNTNKTVQKKENGSCKYSGRGVK